ncbi:aminodeoxychorismate lyase [Gordonia spumicola]|uniref:aminodeoxychorismate lyase n=1 Tax=Gordonia spumicola TaxID=589161 RepID=UPI00137B6EAC
MVVDGDGRVHDPDVPLLHADDLAALRGDGVFETILIRDGRPRLLDAHLARLCDGASRLDLPAPDAAALRRAVGVAAHEWASGDDGCLRIVYSRGRESGGPPTCYLTVTPVPERAARARRDGVTVTLLERGVSARPWELEGAKALSYARNMAALRHAQRAGFDDAIYVSPVGAILESPRANVVAVIDGVLTTPPRDGGVLAGTTLAAVFVHADRPTAEAVLTRDDLIRADGVWLLSSLTLAARVTAVDGHELMRPSSAAPDIPAIVARAILSDSSE